MEKLTLSLQSEQVVSEYIAADRLMPYEKAILSEILGVIQVGDSERISWFGSFGHSLRAVLMNVNAYRKGLEFGFTEIVFDQHGRLVSPKFLEREELKLEQSGIHIGRGANGLWAYALSCTFGSAGSSGPLCVFCRKYPSRDAALMAALEEMKLKMSGYLGNSDTTNYKQDLLQKTLKSIAALAASRVQLALF